MFAYEKAILKSYGKFEEVIDCMDESFMRKALKTFSSRMPTEKLAEKLIDMTERKKSLVRLYFSVGDALSSLKAEDQRILSERYGFDSGKKGVTDEQNRNYYRKLALAVGRFSAALAKTGADSETLEEMRRKFHFIDEACAEALAKEKAVLKIGPLKNVSGVSLRPVTE